MSAKATPEVSPYHHSSYAPVDPRAAARRAQEEREHSRLQELELQTSSARSAEERIRIWERRHALRLPRSPRHPLVSIIATHTHLTVHAVRNEQQRRDGVVSDDSMQPESTTLGAKADGAR
jgi:hypothetical protein